MSERRNQPIPLTFRSVSGGPTQGGAAQPAWLTASANEVRPIDFGARTVTSKSSPWTPRSVSAAHEELEARPLTFAHAQSASAQSAQPQSACAQSASAQSAQPQGASAQSAQPQGASAQSASAQSASAQSASAQGASAQGASAQGASAQGASAQSATPRAQNATPQGANPQGSGAQSAHGQSPGVQSATPQGAPAQAASPPRRASAPGKGVPLAPAANEEPQSDTHSVPAQLRAGGATTGATPPIEAPALTSGPSANEAPSAATASALAALGTATEALGVARAEIIAHAEGELVELAVEIARAILGSELEARPELHRSLVRAALEVLGTEATPRVRLSPEAFDAILTSTGSRAIDAQGQRIELEPDPTLRGAGAVLEAGSASVDGMLDTRLERVRAALLAARRGGAIGEAA
jgi:hypothetical protein